MQNMAVADESDWQRWSREDVAQWLESFGLGKYQQVRAVGLGIYYACIAEGVAIPFCAAKRRGERNA